MHLAQYRPIAIPGFNDPVSSITHLAGAVVFLVLGVQLVHRFRHNRPRTILLSVFAFAAVFQLAMSGVFHMLKRDLVARSVMLRLDHAAIFLLIAATFTPVHGILFQGWRRWFPLAVVWTAAIIGISLRSAMGNAFPHDVGVVVYLVLGWFGFGTVWMIGRRWGLSQTVLPVWGGLAYTIGAIVDFANWPTIIPGVLGPHEIFHIAVLVGLALFWGFVAQIAAKEWTYDREPIKARAMPR